MKAKTILVLLLFLMLISSCNQSVQEKREITPVPRNDINVSLRYGSRWIDFVFDEPQNISRVKAECKTRSMAPTTDCTVTMIINKNPKSIRIGDIITYNRTYLINNVPVSMNISHRVIGINYSQGMVRYVTAGDNNTRQDAYQPVREDIIGKVLLIMYANVSSSIKYDDYQKP